MRDEGDEKAGLGFRCLSEAGARKSGGSFPD